jgi:hypothetical protein
MTTFLTTLFVGIVVAVVSAYVTVRLAIKRFRAEQWWSRKADAYAAILEALHCSKDCDSAHLSEVVEGRELNEEYRTQLLERGRNANWQLRKAIDTSKFLFCNEAVAVLDELRVGLQNADDAQQYVEKLESCYSAEKKCLDQLPAIAKKDLGVK